MLGVCLNFLFIKKLLEVGFSFALSWNPKLEVVDCTGPFARLPSLLRRVYCNSRANMQVRTTHGTSYLLFSILLYSQFRVVFHFTWAVIKKPCKWFQFVSYLSISADSTLEDEFINSLLYSVTCSMIQPFRLVDWRPFSVVIFLNPQILGDKGFFIFHHWE